MRNLRADGGPGDLLAIGTNDKPQSPALRRVVLIAQHACYTHIGLVVSDDLAAPATSTFNHFYRWVRVIAVGSQPHLTSSASVMDLVATSRWPWFQPGGAYSEINRARPLREPAPRQRWCAVVWSGFGLADRVDVDDTKVSLVLDAAHAP